MKRLILPLTLACLASTAFADEVTLRNGSTFTGIVREEGDRVTIEMEFGSMTFRRVDVRSISRGEDVVKTFEEKAAKADGAKGLVEVALWGRDHGLRVRADELLERIIRVDPDQAEARAALGYQRIGGRWLKGDDLLIAQGMTKIDGKWMSSTEAQLELNRREAARVEAARNALEARTNDQKHEEKMVA